MLSAPRLDAPAVIAYQPRFDFKAPETSSLMSRVCELTGVRRQIGHKVSHSNIKTKRSFDPNLVNVTLTSDVLGRAFRFRIAAAALRSVDHVGGLDAFLLKSGEDTLSERAVKIRRELKKRQGETAAAA